MKREHLTDYLKQYLALDRFQDAAPNGLQIAGKPDITKIITGVTACEALIDRAIEQQADAILVHHGYFWKGENPCLTGMKRQRIAKLLAHNINLFAYHLPLDAHPQHGNNVQLAQLCGFQRVEFLAGSYGQGVGCKGELLLEQSVENFTVHLSNILQRQPQVIKVSDKPINTIAWCTGAAQDYIEYAAELGVDAYISGEISERTYHQAHELGIHYFACGHHATERYGVKALGEHIAVTFSIDVEFIDINNPV